MAELAALNVKITGDSSGLAAAVGSAKGQLGALNAAVKQTQVTTGGMVNSFGRASAGASGFSQSMRGVSQQLSQVGQQTMATGNFVQALAIQLPDLGLAFGTVGAAVGLLAGIALPLVISAFSSTSENATALTSAMAELTDATEAFRISAQAIRLGVDEREVLIVEQLANKMAELEAAEQRLRANRGSQDHVNTLRAEVAALDQQLARYRQRRDEAEKAKTAAEAFKSVQQSIAGIDISGPWRSVLGAIDNAIAKADAYRASIGGGRGMAGPGGPLVGSADLSELQAGGGTVRNMPAPSVGGGVGGGGGGGVAAESPLQAEIDAMLQAMMTQEQLQAESFARQQEMLTEALAQRLITQEQYQAMMQQAQSAHDFAMTQSVNKGVTDTLSALGSLFQGSKKISAAIAVANSWLAFTEVLKDPSFVGRPWARVAAAGQALAAGLNAVKNIKSGGTSGAGGGRGGGGGVSASAPQQNVQTLNFTVQNDSFGIGQNLIRQIAAQLNEAQRNGSTLIRATVA